MNTTTMLQIISRDERETEFVCYGPEHGDLTREQMAEKLYGALKAGSSVRHVASWQSFAVPPTAAA